MWTLFTLMAVVDAVYTRSISGRFVRHRDRECEAAASSQLIDVSDVAHGRRIFVPETLRLFHLSAVCDAMGARWFGCGGEVFVTLLVQPGGECAAKHAGRGAAGGGQWFR
jgi:hypothetical protein